MRHVTAEKINPIVNHPSIHPWVRGPFDGTLDVSAVVGDPRNVALFDDRGGAIFVHHQAGLYEIHTQVLPAARGPQAIEMVREALHWMFTRTEAVEIVTRVPRGNIAAKALARRCGFAYEFTNPRGWFNGPEAIPAGIYSLKVQDWMREAPWLIQRGQWFHDRLEEEYERAGKQHDLHPDDDAHDRYVGAAVEMIFGGQPHKGLVFYNRFAVMGGYQPAQIVAERPVTVDIRDAVLIFRDDNFWVI